MVATEGSGVLESRERTAPDGWERDAACRTVDATLFFGPNRFEPKRDRLAREAEAKAICMGCPALLACRDYALRNSEMYGVWGGLAEADRRALLAQRLDPSMTAEAS